MKSMLIGLVAVLTLGSVAMADKKYTLVVTPPASAKKGQKATTKVHIECIGDWKFIKEYPTRLKITAPAGVTVEKASQTGADATFAGKGADFQVNFTASEMGKKDFTGELKFACGRETDSSPQTEVVRFSIEVK